jgi:hypothetical protein
MKEENLQELYYTEEEVASFLNKTVFSLRSDASRRKGAPRTKLGRKILYKKSSFMQWMSKRETDFDVVRKGR